MNINYVITAFNSGHFIKLINVRAIRDAWLNYFNNTEQSNIVCKYNGHVLAYCSNTVCTCKENDFYFYDKSIIKNFSEIIEYEESAIICGTIIYRANLNTYFINKINDSIKEMEKSGFAIDIYERLREYDDDPELFIYS